MPEKNKIYIFIYIYIKWGKTTWFSLPNGLIFGTAIRCVYMMPENVAWFWCRATEREVWWRRKRWVYNYSVTRSFISSLINFTEPPVHTSDPAHPPSSNRSQITWAALLVQQNQWVKALRRKRPSVNENDKTITSAAGSLAESETGERDKRSKGGGGGGDG